MEERCVKHIDHTKINYKFKILDTLTIGIQFQFQYDMYINALNRYDVCQRHLDIFSLPNFYKF